jgi:predicted GNAT family acetyltransferase
VPRNIRAIIRTNDPILKRTQHRHGDEMPDQFGKADPASLERPPWSALTSAHATLAIANDHARRYPPDVSPLAALADNSETSLHALAALMHPGDIVGLFSAAPVSDGGGLHALEHKVVEQMVFEGGDTGTAAADFVTLTAADVPDMLRLVRLTKPGPFAPRTIELGSYIGIRRNNRLIAMAGERMRFDGFTEISAVCTHPDHRTCGHATALVRTLMRNIIDRGDTPFLHIYSDNTAAASLYRSLGFALRRSITVSVLTRPA